MQLFKNTKINFLRYGKLVTGLSVGFILVSLVVLVARGGFNMSIDFRGGTTVLMKFEQPVRDELPTIRNSIGSLGFGQPEIKTIGLADNNQIQITVRNTQQDGVSITDALQTALKDDLPGNGFTVLSVDEVGPKIGGELRRDAFITAILALLSILIYIGFRFNLPFAIAATIPLTHDALIVLGIFALFDIELSLPFIAAILTVIGYSLNSTIVVFDRIRENAKGGLKGKDFTEIVNHSLNQTLTRTVITTVTTLFTVAAVYLLGSDSIKNFSLALLIGFTAGGYSTLFISSYILVAWNKKQPIYK
ncbi:MAG: protein translocase subunit SecF [Chitinispirillales bacterium]|jgi:preprotein translocase subunit SecF|nr:protein translocase subunit SecF [Chitinispirillales bacterium]